jgi:hypothetical protein
MAKAPNLQDVVTQAAKPRGGSGNNRVSSRGSKQQAQEYTKRVSPGPAREGKKVVAGFFDPAVSKRLRTIALDRDSSVQELLREALNDLFVKLKEPPIA